MLITPPLSFAPTELGLACDRCSYKHHAPTELTRLVAAQATLRLRSELFVGKIQRLKERRVNVSLNQIKSHAVETDE